MRVAFCIDNMNAGGTELNAVRTAERLVASGVDVSVFCLSFGGALRERYAQLGVEVDTLCLGKLYGPTAVLQGRRLLGILRERSVDVLHAHDFYSNIFAVPWARAAGAATIASRRWWEGPDRRLQRVANRASYALADIVLANSPGVARLLTEVERVPTSKVRVVRNFLEEAAFSTPPAGWRESILRDLDVPASAIVVGIVASLQPIKDHATLLRAVSSLVSEGTDIYVLMVGADAGSRSDLEQLTHALGLASRVRFTGFMANRPSAHHLFDISVLSSISEGLPNSILEAMAAGRPVVATRVGAVPDAVAHLETGILVPPGDPRTLATALGRMVQDIPLRNRLGAAGIVRARTHYSADAALGALLDCYDLLTLRRSKTRPAVRRGYSVAHGGVN